MRNILCALFVFSALLSGAQSFTKELLIGKWQFVQLRNGENATHVDSMQKAITENLKGLQQNGVVTKADSAEAEAQIKSEFDALRQIYMQFDKDGRFHAKVGTAEHMYEVKNATYKWENDKLVSMHELDMDEMESWEIEELTEHKLVLKESHDDSYTIIEFKR